MPNFTRRLEQPSSYGLFGSFRLEAESEAEVEERFTTLVVAAVAALLLMSVIYAPFTTTQAIRYPGVVAAVAMLSILVIQHFTRNITLCTSLAALTIFALLGHMIFNGIDTIEATFWLFQYTLFAHLFTGVKRSFVWLSAGFTILLVAIELGNADFIDFEYSYRQYASLVLAALTSSFFAYMYESAINEYIAKISLHQRQSSQRESYYGALISNLGDGLIATDKDGRVTMANNEALRILQREFLSDIEELAGQKITDALKVNHSSQGLLTDDEHPVMRVLKTGHRIESPELNPVYNYQRKDGTFVPVHVSISPIHNRGENKGTVQIFRDATIQQNIDEAKDSFVSLASHQLRTPLSSISWTTELLLNHRANLSADDAELADQIYESAQNMNELVNALLDVSRLELGTMEINLQEANIRELVDTIIDRLSPEVDRKKINLDYQPAPPDTTATTDAKFLGMVIDNLVSNAIKYAPEGNVRVSVEPIGTAQQVGNIRATRPSILFTVVDNGYGIPEEQQGQIFKKLFRADNVRNSNVDGTGLGLYLARLIVTQLRGDIWFESKVGQGSTFFVMIPIDSI